MSYEDICKEAKKFLAKYHPDDGYSIPIERIVEVKLRISIIAIPGLLDVLEVDGWLASNLKEIFVDKSMYDRKPPRYSFTLAHEVGHYILHANLYRKYKINSTEGWVNFIQRFPERELRWFEWQARAFAGLILTPTHHLEKRCEYQLKRLKLTSVKDKRLILKKLLDLLARDFCVSTTVIKKRLEKEDDLPEDLRKVFLLNFYS